MQTIRQSKNGVPYKGKCTHFFLYRYFNNRISVLTYTITVFLYLYLYLKYIYVSIELFIYRIKELRVHGYSTSRFTLIELNGVNFYTTYFFNFGGSFFNFGLGISFQKGHFQIFYNRIFSTFGVVMSPKVCCCAKLHRQCVKITHYLVVFLWLNKALKAIEP